MGNKRDLKPWKKGMDPFKDKRPLKVTVVAMNEDGTVEEIFEKVCNGAAIMAMHNFSPEHGMHESCDFVATRCSTLDIAMAIMQEPAMEPVQKVIAMETMAKRMKD